MDPADPEPPAQSGQDAPKSLANRLERLEHLLAPQIATVKAVEARVIPAWRKATEGEHRLPVAAAVAVAIVLQLVLPARLVIRPAWLLPSLEVLLIAGLVAANPRRINRTSVLLRTASVCLIALIFLANAWSSAELIRGFVEGTSETMPHCFSPEE